MGKRHESIGIKQTLRFEWMQRAAGLLLAGLDAQTIRYELHDFLMERKGSGSESMRGLTSRTQVVNILMNIWITPDSELLPFRDESLEFMREHPLMSLAVHWGMISAAYPFWFNVARQTGRLLALQEQVKQMQIINRLKEQYGDRQTVSRYARCVIRSFVAWEVIKDSNIKGCYETSYHAKTDHPKMIALMLEAALHTVKEGKGELDAVLNSPAFFPFKFPALSGILISRENSRLDVIRHGLHDELIKLKT